MVAGMISYVSIALVIIAVNAAEEIAAKRGKDRLKQNLRLIQDTLFWMILGALLGGRLTYVAGHRAEFHSLGDMLAIWRGGFSEVGGVVGALLGVAFTLVQRLKQFVRKPETRA